MSFTMYTLYVVLGGIFVIDPKVEYVGREVQKWDVDPDVISHPTIIDQIKRQELWSGVKKLYYLKPRTSLDDGLVLCWDNKSFNDTIETLIIDGEIHVYVDHVVEGDKEKNTNEAPLMPPLSEAPSLQPNKCGNATVEAAEVMCDLNEGLEDVNVGGVTQEEVHVEEVNESDESGDEVEFNAVDDLLNRGEVGDKIVAEDDQEPLHDVEWVSDKDDEELQEINKFYKAHKNAGKDSNAPREDISQLVDAVGKRRDKKKSKKSNSKAGGSKSAGSDTDYLDSDNEGSYEVDEDGEEVIKHSNKVYFDPSDELPVLQVGMIFENPKQLKDGLNKLALKQHFDFRFTKNAGEKIQAKCKGKNCHRSVYATVDGRDGMFKFITL